MPSMLHESVIMLFRQNPHLATELIGDRMHVPEGARIDIDSADLGDIAPTEYRADAVITITDQHGALIRAVVIEIQLSRDPDKHYTWPVYLTNLRARLRCPTNLLIIAVDPAVASWCAQPIEMGDQGFTLKPWVIGPADVPAITDRARLIELPELGVLSVAAHSNEAGAEHIALATIAAMHQRADEQSTLYADLVYYLLGATARAALEKLMQSGKYQYRSDFAREYFAKGLAEGEARGRAEGEARGRVEGRAEGRVEGRKAGRAEGLLLALEMARYPVPEHLRAHIQACDDAATLDLWYSRIRTASALSDIFTPDLLKRE